MNLVFFTSLGVWGSSPQGFLRSGGLLRWVLCTLMLLGISGAVNAKRVALVIGNDQYQSVDKLNNARNDAKLMASVLTKAGFAVSQASDLGREKLWNTIDSFKAGIVKGDEVVFYFAGHGVQIGSTQLLLPVDINPRNEAQVQRDGVPLIDVQDALKDARVAIFIIDACRDNPFPKQGTRTLGASRGLLPPEPSSGQIIILSAGRNQRALDRVPGQNVNNGLFTWELAQVLQAPGVEIRNALERVKDTVDDKARAAGHEQRPSLVNDLRGSFFFFGTTTAQVAPSASPVFELTPAQKEEKFWDDAKLAGNKEAFEAYLDSYPKGRYVNLAKANIARLTIAAPQTVQTPTPVAQPGQDMLGKVFKDCADCPEMVVIPAGRFVMGAQPGEEEREKLPDSFRNRSQPQREVSVSSFVMARNEVTVGQYRAFVTETNRSTSGGCFVWTGTKFETDLSKDWRSPGFTQTDSHPVACVSWEDATAYTQWLKQKTGKDYKLPTEAQWEYAARAGTTTSRFWGDDGNMSCTYANGADLKAKADVPGASTWTVANCDDRYAYTAPVGFFRANAFGLHDMLGNVWEWTQDCWHENYVGAPNDSSAWTQGDCSRRVLRGGSWFSLPQFLRSASRSGYTTAGRNNVVGFRVARTP